MTGTAAGAAPQSGALSASAPHSACAPPTATMPAEAASSDSVIALLALSTAAAPPKRVRPMAAVKRAAPVPGETERRGAEAAVEEAEAETALAPLDSSGSSAEETSSPALEM